MIKKLILSIRNQKLNQKMFISHFIIAVIPLILVTNVFYMLAKNNINEVSSNFINLYASQKNLEINSYIEDIDKRSKRIYNSEILTYLINEPNYSKSQFISNKLDIDQFLVSMMQQDERLFGITLISAHGYGYSMGYSQRGIDKDILTKEKWYKQIKESDGELVVTSAHKTPYLSIRSNEDVFSIGRVIKDEYGELAAVMIFEVRPVELMLFNPDHEKISEQFNTRITIRSSDDQLIFDSKAHLVGENKNLYREKDTLILTNESEMSGVKVSVFIPEANLLSTINNFGNITIVILIVVTIFLIVISYYISHYITRPIIQLTRSIRKTAEGNRVMIKRSNRNDEIGILEENYNRMVLKIKYLIEDVYLAQLKEQQAELLALQNQINPHMLFNTLESIRMEAVVNNDLTTADMIKNLAKMFRLTLNRFEDEYYIKDEIEYVQTYVELQNIRYDNRFQLNIDLGKEILNTKIINLVFQPIIENSIIHGFKDIEEKCYISIVGKIIDNGILIQFRDDGIGVKKDKVDEINKYLEISPNRIAKPRKNIGLKNIYDRIKIRYGSQYYLKIIKEQKEGFVVEIFIPQKSREE